MIIMKNVLELDKKMEYLTPNLFLNETYDTVLEALDALNLGFDDMANIYIDDEETVFYFENSKEIIYSIEFKNKKCVWSNWHD